MATDDTYVPGVCNIGGPERGRRAALGWLATLATLVGLAALVALGAPSWTRLVLALPASGAASGFLQARRGFCAGYASAGVLNFGPAGEVTRITDPAALAADRKAALRLGVEAGVIGVAVALATLVL